jgi:AmmeMemoRadiSam system protein B
MKQDSRQYPDLRALEVHPVMQDGQRLLLLADPLHLRGKQILLSIELAPLLGLMNGENSIDTLAELSGPTLSLPLSRDQIHNLVEQLDQVAMLRGESFDSAYADALDAFRRADHRGSFLAGTSYPTDPEACMAEFDDYLARAGSVPQADQARGLISPHIDYERGWQVYARTWSAARQVIQSADLAIIFGTDHYSDQAPITLTRQHYATPFGILPTSQEWVEAIAETLAPYSPFGGELRHRSEHSIELAALWLHYLRAGKHIELVPVLCGDIEGLTRHGKDGHAQDALHPFLSTLRLMLDQRKVIVIAAADLSHIGPAFGDLVLDRPDLAGLSEYDDQLMNAIEAGDSDAFLGQILQSGNRTNVCGTAPIYLALETLAPTTASRIAYQQCPADSDGTSFVTICGHLLA